MKPFMNPEIEILKFSVEDIIASSVSNLPDLALDDIGWDDAN